MMEYLIYNLSTYGIDDQYEKLPERRMFDANQ